MGECISLDGENGNTPDKRLRKGNERFWKNLIGSNKDMSDMGAALKEMRAGMEKVGGLRPSG